MNKNYYLYADPFWGNGATAAPPGKGVAKHWNWLKAQSGNTHPGALLPFGWVSVLPYSGAYSSGYGCIGVSSDGEAPRMFERPMAKGFTHFHTTGVGFLGEFYNYLLLTPVSASCDPQVLSRLDNESASPGYYKGTLSDYGVDFELTATDFAAIHRCTFHSSSGSLTLDVSQLGLQKVRVQEKITSFEYRCAKPGIFTGSLLAHGEKLFFAWSVSGNISEQSVAGSCITFELSGKTAESILAFSRKSESEALLRVQQTRNHGFEQIREQARKRWENIFSNIRAEFTGDDEKTIFYSALYHSLLKPVDSGTEFTDFQTMWDIYRTQLPLAMSFVPETAEKILRSMLKTIQKLGYFPCTYMMSDNYSNHDMQATTLAVYSLSDGFFRGLLTKEDYPELKKAFIAEFSHADVREKSPTHTLDLAGAYFAASQVAEKCGDKKYAEQWRNNSGIWRNVYDPSTGLLIENAIYYEGDNWNYSFRPHADMDDRVNLAGGKENFEVLLDKFFGVDCTDDYPVSRPMIPHRFEGMNNESDMETPGAYLWCGRADKQALIHAAIRSNMFGKGIGGCPGNNDSGGLSSWYVWSCLGLIPQTGTPYMLLASPSVITAEVSFGKNKLIIEVERSSETAIYPQYYEFNGNRFTEPYIALEKLVCGGVLKFVLSDIPQKKSSIPDWL